MKYRVLVSDSLSQEGVDILQSHPDVQVDVNTKLTPEQLREAIAQYDALVIRSGTQVTKEVIGNAAKLKVIGRAGVGVDNVDLNEATQRGIIVMNTPGGNTVSTAEHTWAMLMSLARNVAQANLSLRQGKWDRKKYTGSELFGKTLGIIGLGRIGSVVGSRALAFGMKVLGFDPFTSAERVEQMGFQAATLDEIYANSDFITVHTPKSKDTFHLLDESAFAKMKKGVRVINWARGGIIDEQALLKALESGKCAGAALDVYEEEPPRTDYPLLHRDDVVCTPHLGASTEEAQINVAIDIAHCVLDALIKSDYRNAVNIPSISPELRAAIGPYLPLVDKLGQFAVQYLGKHLDKVEVTYAGPLSAHDTTFLTIAVLKGIMTSILQEPVNFVNAPVLAQKRNIRYSETKSPQAEAYSNLVTVRLTSDSETAEISGTLFGDKDPRIVRVDGVHIDAKPFGHILFFINRDEPGAIGHVGTVLGRNRVNIADMTLGRRERGGHAVTVINVDTQVPDSVMDELRSFPVIREIKYIYLK